MVLYPEARSFRVDPLVGVRPESGHLTPRPGQATVTHQVGHLVRRLRREGPKVPLHVGVAQAGAGQPLLRVDEVGELDAIADEEHRGVASDDVVVAFAGVKLHREAAHVAPGVWAALFACHARKALQGLGLRPRLEDGSAGVSRNIRRHLEATVGAAALGVHDALRDTFAVELRELFDEVAVVQRCHALGARGERVGVARDWRAGLGCCWLGHGAPCFVELR